MLRGRWAIRVTSPFGPKGDPLARRWRTRRRAERAAKALSGRRWGEPIYEAVRV